MKIKMGKGGNSLIFDGWMLDKRGIRKIRKAGECRKDTPALNIPDSGPINVRPGDGTKVKSDGSIEQ